MTVAGCGGGGYSGDDDDGPDDPTPTLSSLTVTLPDGNELRADADTVEEGITVLALTKDADNIGLEGVRVTFSSTSGDLVINSNTTDGSGRATATLSTAGNPAIRTITVVVTAGRLQESVDIQVVPPPTSEDAIPRLGFVGGDGTFQSGVIGIAQTPLSAGGSSGLTVNVRDIATDTPFTDPVDVTFTSNCIAAGLARIDPAATVTSAGGAVNATYVALGCSGDDLITARGVANGTNMSATGTINIRASALGSIEFVSATPTTLGLRGTGLQETSAVVFRVRNSTGGPVADELVRFSLNTDVGGITLEPETARTGTDGTVQTIVRAGTVHTSVRVTASATQAGRTVSSQSERLVITTGIPDQDSFSLSAECFNVEGLNVDGVTVPLTMHLADRYNNPVPDGTSISFTTEGGSIDGECETEGGVCTVDWTSQNPRPPALNGCEGPGATQQGTDNRCSVVGRVGASRAGRSTVLAYAIGEESFVDADGDGLRDPTETSRFAENDLPEAFVDKDADGNRDATDALTEEFFDFNRNFAYDDADGKYNGLLCDNGTVDEDGNPVPVLCPLPRTLYVRDSQTIVMSGSNAVVNKALTSNRGDVSVTNEISYDETDGDIVVQAGQVIVLNVVVRDVNDQPMPSGTTVSFSASGEAGTVLGTSSFTVPCTTNDTAIANTYGVAFKGAAVEAPATEATGLLELKITSPGGIVTVVQFNVTARP
ncbi:MAG TPA: Ig-like domain-containing protein [Nevskiaceae bacterium]|nr:Ig-like domain-containing protein [Nevskiaceae bacterium]